MKKNCVCYKILYLTVVLAGIYSVHGIFFDTNYMIHAQTTGDDDSGGDDNNTSLAVSTVCRDDKPCQSVVCNNDEPCYLSNSPNPADSIPGNFLEREENEELIEEREEQREEIEEEREDYFDIN
jgi:hypothetical protein